MVAVWRCLDFVHFFTDFCCWCCTNAIREMLAFLSPSLLSPSFVVTVWYRPKMWISTGNWIGNARRRTDCPASATASASTCSIVLRSGLAVHIRKPWVFVFLREAGAEERVRGVRRDIWYTIVFSTIWCIFSWFSFEFVCMLNNFFLWLRKDVYFVCSLGFTPKNVTRLRFSVGEIVWEEANSYRS